MDKKYPNIGKFEKRDKNTQAKCKCGAIGKRKVHIQCSHFRGEDEVVWACMDHFKDVDYLYFDEALK
jgi:hypothetical protein